MRVGGGKRIILLLFASVLLLAASAWPGLANEDGTSSGNTGTGFMWVAQERNPPLWSKVREALRQELAPDVPVPHKMAYGYKYILRIGVYGDWALVLIGERADKSDPPELDHFLAFTYDLRNSRKSKVTPLSHFMSWRFVGLARFERSPVPDVVFTHVDCVECESVEQLSSFRFNSKDTEWKLRVWPLDGTDLFIGGAIRDEPPHTHESTCLYSMRDFNGDRLEDIAIWCRDRDVIRGGEKDSAVLYTMRGDTPARIVPVDPLLKSIKGELCRQTPGSPLCGSGN